MNIAGRFTLYARGASYVAIGCVGALWSADLSDANIQYIRGYYNIPETWVHRRESDWPQQKLPRGNFNDFIVFREA